MDGDATETSAVRPTTADASADTPGASRHAASSGPTSRRLVAWSLATLVALHSVLILLWVAPVNPMRDAVGNARLASYINPWFEQSWSVFAPTPRRFSDVIRIRASVQNEDGTTEITEWAPVTDDVTSKVLYDMTPPRFEEATRRLASRVNGVMFKFNAQQRQLVRGGYIETSTDQLAEALFLVRGNDGAGEGDINSYILHDKVLTNFSTMYAQARWGGDGKEVVQIQYLVGYQTVPAYASRNETTLDESPVQNWVFGWRGADPGSQIEQDAFDDYVKDFG